MKKYYIILLSLFSFILMYGNNAPSLKKKTKAFPKRAILLDYCTPNPTDPEAITLVSIGSINNITSPQTTVGYEDFTTISTDLGIFRTYEIRLKGNTEGNYLESFTVYIDFNGDGIFGPVDITDTEGKKERFELGYIQNSTGLDDKVLTANITVPGNAKLGSTRMRVMKRQTTSVPIKYATNGCDLGNTYGQVEDYTVNIMTPQGCDTSANGANLTSLFIPSHLVNIYSYQTITNTAKTGAYTEILVREGITYSFKLGVPNIFTTFKSQDGVTLMTNTEQEFSWTSPITGILRWYTHSNEACLSGSEVFSQQLKIDAGKNPIKEPCNVGTPGTNGHVSESLGGTNQQELAIDLPMYNGKSSTINGITLVLEGNATYINFEELNDANNLPGSLISNITGTIQEKTLAYTVDGKSFYKYIVKFNTPILTYGTLTESRKWLNIKTDAAALEADPYFAIGNAMAVKNNTTSWNLHNKGYEIVYQLSAVCTQQMCTQAVTANPVNPANPNESFSQGVLLANTFSQLIDIVVDPGKQLTIKGIDIEAFIVSSLTDLSDNKQLKFNLRSNDPTTNKPNITATPLFTNIPVANTKEKIGEVADEEALIRKYKVTAIFDQPLVLDGATSTKYWLEIFGDYPLINAVSDAPEKTVGEDSYLFAYTVDPNIVGDLNYLLQNNYRDIVYNLLITDCTSTLGTQNQGVEKQNTKIYPVPFSTKLTVDSPSTLTKVEIYSVSGAKVLHINTNQKKLDLNVEQLPKGVYIISTTDNKGIVSSNKIVKN